MASNIKVVAISQRVVEVPAYREFRDCLDQQWAVWLHSLDLLAVPVPNRLSSPTAFLRRLQPHGIILSGGNNLAAIAYEGSLPARGIPDAYPERDHTEEALANYAVETRTPLLGCCRGMQFLQVFFGGRLSSLANLTVPHVASTHDITITDARLRAIAERDSVLVNSFHNYGIAGASLAKDLQPLAVSPADNTVEAFAHRDLPMIGIMWHPERPNPAASVDLKMAGALFAGHWPRNEYQRSSTYVSTCLAN